MASSRSTPSSDGIETYARSASSKGRSWHDRPEEAHAVIDLEVPKKLRTLVEQAHAIATSVFRPISRKYDLAEHTYPKELDILAAILDGVSDGGGSASASQLKRDTALENPSESPARSRN